MSVVVGVRALSADNDLDILRLISLIKASGSVGNDSKLLTTSYWKRHIGHTFISLVTELGSEMVAHAAIRLSSRSRTKTAILLHRFADAAIQDFEDKIVSAFASSICSIATHNGVSFVLTGTPELDSNHSSLGTPELKFSPVCFFPKFGASHSNLLVEAAPVIRRTAPRIFPSASSVSAIQDIYKSFGETADLISVAAINKHAGRQILQNSFFDSVRYNLASKAAKDWVQERIQTKSGPASLLLNLEDPGCAELANFIESNGAVFSGLLPNFMGHDSAVYTLSGDMTFEGVIRHSRVSN